LKSALLSFIARAELVTKLSASTRSETRVFIETYDSPIARSSESVT
jgi:hypothetical protein